MFVFPPMEFEENVEPVSFDETFDNDENDEYGQYYEIDQLEQIDETEDYEQSLENELVDISFNPFDNLTPELTMLPEYIDELYNPNFIDENIQNNIQNIVYDIHIIKYWNDVAHETLLSLAPNNPIIQNIHNRLDSIANYLIDKITKINSDYLKNDPIYCTTINQVREMINQTNTLKFKIMKKILFKRIKNFLDNIEIDINLQNVNRGLYEILRNSSVAETPVGVFLHENAFVNLVKNWLTLRPVLLDGHMEQLIEVIQNTYGIQNLNFDNLLETYQSLEPEQQLAIREWVLSLFSNNLENIYGMIDIGVVFSQIKEVIYDIYINFTTLLEQLGYKCQYLQNDIVMSRGFNFLNE